MAKLYNSLAKEYVSLDDLTNILKNYQLKITLGEGLGWVSPETNTIQVTNKVNALDGAVTLNPDDFVNDNNTIKIKPSIRGYELFQTIDVNATSYVFDNFENNYWYLFNVEYLGDDNKPYSGTLERMENLTLTVKDCNVGNDFASSSSATIQFDGETKTLQVLNWGQNPRTINKVTIFRK